MSFKSLAEATSFSPEKMKKNKLFDTSHLSCDLYCFEPGQEQKIHSHDNQDKIYLILEGSGTFRVGNDEKVLSKGMIVLAEGGKEHGVKNSSSGRLVLVVVVAPASREESHGHKQGHHHH
jgi:quercetin dioxygenase-like cupin family protein